MQIDTNTVISMTEANQNFSKVARLVDHYGKAVVFKNNAPRYLVIDFAAADRIDGVSTADLLVATDELMDKYDEAFKELAK
ncbi:MAG: type II toxin-antitoxin system Phd/YefM family antitoxin [Clostridiales bacterium]|nr:type II toxin-antitoxin system Phd/YefM family antitoxin [Clostridiales bacterium]